MYAAPYKTIFDNGENGIVTVGPGNIKENNIFGYQYSSNYICLNSNMHVHHNWLNIV